MAVEVFTAAIATALNLFLETKAGAPASRLEEIVLCLLEASSRVHGHRIIPQWRSPTGRHRFDAFIDGSIDNLPPPVGVEIISRSPNRERIASYIRFLQ